MLYIAIQIDPFIGHIEIATRWSKAYGWHTVVQNGKSDVALHVARVRMRERICHVLGSSQRLTRDAGSYEVLITGHTINSKEDIMPRPWYSTLCQDGMPAVSSLRCRQPAIRTGRPASSSVSAHPNRAGVVDLVEDLTYHATDTGVSGKALLGGIDRRGEVMEGLPGKAHDAEDFLVVVAGTIARQDVAVLKCSGMDEVFVPETPVEQIVDYIQEHVT